MSREILFRGKRLDNGGWETGSLIIIRYGCSDARHYITDKMTGYPIPIDPATVGQYTGLCDKNGKKIFEGDIVESVDDGTVGAREWDAVFGKHHEIYWVKQDMQDFFGTVYIGFEMPLCAHSEYMAVIGNIYDKEEQDALQGKFAQEGRCTFDE